MAETNKEVKPDTEIISSDAIADEETEDEEDEEVIPPVEEEEKSEEEKHQEGEDSETDSDTSSEKEGDETPPLKTKEPAPVEGETPREKALRIKVQQLRTALRKENVQEIAGPGDKKPKPNERLAKLRESYSEEEIQKAEELIDVLAESKGYVKAETNYQTVVNNTVEEFIDENPEFKPENDPEDVRWKTFQEILKSGIYNISNKTPKQLKVIFSKVKSDVDEELGEPETKKKIKIEETEERKQAAQRQKIKSVSHGGGTKSASEENKKTIDPSVRNMFKGFDDSDFE